MKNLALLILLVSMVSCHKDKPAAPYSAVISVLAWERTVNPFLTATCFFKPGSYWVYKDSASLRTDSVYVLRADTGSVLRISVESGANRDLDQWFSVVYHSSYYNRDFRLNAYTSTEIKIMQQQSFLVFDTTHVYMHIYSGSVELPDSTEYIKVFEYPIVDQNRHAGYVTDLRATDSVIVNGVVLSGNRYLQSKNMLNNRKPATIVLKEGIGLIKISMPDSGRVWRLRKQQIVQ
jgi:hypothetical protein